MALKDTSLLGVDLHPQEIRVVQVRLRSNKATIGKIGRSTMPEGAMVNGMVTNPVAVAVALRLLLNSMDLGSTSRAVVGVQGGSVAVRNLTIPPVPDSELPLIVAGEVSHYGLLQSERGAFGFLRLSALPRSVTEPIQSVPSDKRETLLDPAASDINPVLVSVFATEEDVITSLQMTLEQANLTVEAIEPTQYGMLRTVLAATGPSSTFFALLISPDVTDIAFVFEGKMIGYRRIDVGSSHLIGTGPVADDGGVFRTRSPLVDEFGHKAAPQAEEALNHASVDAMSVEIQRTLDYYQRQFIALTVGDQIYAAVDDARLQPLGELLSRSLGVNVEVVKPASQIVEDQSSLSDLEGGLGAAYSAAAGLALQGPIVTRLPRIDLFSKLRAGAKQAEIKRNFTGSILASLLAIVLGASMYFVYQRQTSAVNAEIKSLTDHIKAIEAQAGQSATDRNSTLAQYKQLRSEGIPFSTIISYVASSFQQGAGLVSINISNDLVVQINGQAGTETDMVDATKNLQKCPVLTDLKIVNFHQRPIEDGGGVDFEMEGRALSNARVALHGDKS